MGPLWILAKMGSWAFVGLGRIGCGDFDGLGRIGCGAFVGLGRIGCGAFMGLAMAKMHLGAFMGWTNLVGQTLQISSR